LQVIEDFGDTVSKLLPAKKREFEELDYMRCKLIDKYGNHPHLKSILIIFDASSGYTQLLKEIKSMTRIMGIGGKRNRRERGMAVLPLEEVKQIPILDVFDFKNIKKTGRRVMVSCPLHEDLTPSMLINTNNTFHCFSCQKSGTNIDLTMELYGFDFVTAVKRLQGNKSKSTNKDNK
jgi:hypothetical protein